MIRQTIALLLALSAAGQACAEVRKIQGRKDAVITPAPVDPSDPCSGASFSRAMAWQGLSSARIDCMTRSQQKPGQDPDPGAPDGAECFLLEATRPRDSRTQIYVGLRAVITTCLFPEEGASAPTRTSTTIVTGESIVRGEGACSVIGAIGKSC